MHNLRSVVTLRERLRAIVSRDVFRGQQEANERLSADVRDVVDELRDLGWTPERIVVAIKQITEEAGLRHSKHWLRVGGRQTPRDEFMGQIVRWAIQRYVDASVPSAGYAQPSRRPSSETLRLATLPARRDDVSLAHEPVRYDAVPPQ